MRRIAVALAACACLVVLVVVAAFASGASLDLSRWREAASARASAALGRPVALQGAMQLTLGRGLLLRLGDVRIANPPGFDAAGFATVGEAAVRVDLFDALRGRLRLLGVRASDVELHLERAADGRGNWIFSSTRNTTSPGGAIDLGPIELRRLVVHLHDERSATRRSFALDALSGSIAPGERLRLALQGRMDGGPAYRIGIEGDSLQALQEGSGPWPFNLALESPVARFDARGTFDANAGEARFDFDAGADDAARAAHLAGARWPLPGGASLRGSVVAHADDVAVEALQGRIGASAISGRLRWSSATARPRLSGALDIATLDPRAFLPAESPPARAPDDAQAWRTLALRDLAPADVELDLGIGRLLGLPVAVDDAKLALRADARGVRATLSATIAGARASGRLDLDLGAPVPALALALDLRDLALGGLAREVPGLQGLDGTLGRATLHASGRGDTPDAVLRDLGLSLRVAAARLGRRGAAGAPPIAVAFDTLQLDARRGERVHGEAQGKVLGEQARLAFRAGTLRDMLDRRAVPLELEFARTGTTLRIRTVFGPDASAGDGTFDVDLEARRAGDLAHWLPVAPAATLPVALRGQIRRTPQAWVLAPATLDLGRTRFEVEARRTRDFERPLTTTSVRSALVDVPQLATLFDRGREPAAAGTRLDAPVLASAFELEDADLELDLQRVALGRLDLVDVGVVARAREGRLLPSQVRGKLAGAPFAAKVGLDASGAVPAATIDLSARDVDVGALLRALGVADDVDARADSLELALQARGNSLRQLAAGTALKARVAGGRVVVTGAAKRPAVEILLREAHVDAPAGQPVRLRLDGMLDESPVQLQLATGSFADFAYDATRVPLSMAAEAAGARLRLDGEVTLPLGSGGRLDFELGGERLDTLNELARVELPAWGPWSLRGPIRMTDTGYASKGLTLSVGQSRLTGSGSFDVDGPRPRAELRVVAPTIQLDDFPPPQRMIDPDATSGPVTGLRDTSKRTAGRVDRLLSARFLRRFDATVEVRADHVLSGADRLADGTLRLVLREGRLDLDPAMLNLPGGGMRLTMAYDLKQSEVDFRVAARIERFDYGIIARRLDRADDLRGLFSLNLDMTGRAPALDSIMRYANGSLDIAVWPTELRSGVFNLWSANLILKLLPLIDPGQKSQVNCIVGRFDLKDGILGDDKFLIDTSTVRIRGTGQANLRSEELDWVFRPRAKGPRLFRLQTPLRVRGTLTDQRFEFDPKDVAVSVARMAASPVLVPLEWFTLGPLPADGADICTDPLRPVER